MPQVGRVRTKRGTGSLEALERGHQVTDAHFPAQAWPQSCRAMLARTRTTPRGMGV